MQYTLYITLVNHPITFSVESLVRNRLNCAHAVYGQSRVSQRQSDQFTKFAFHIRLTILWLVIVIDFY